MDAGLLRRAAELKNDDKILVQIRDKDCVAIEVRYHKMCYRHYTKFLTREQKEIEKSTPTYEKTFEVFCKDVIEGQIINNKEIRYMKELLNKFIAMAMETDQVDASNYRAFKLKQRLKKRYPQLVFYTPRMRNLSEMVFVEDFDSTGLIEEHMLQKAPEVSDDEEKICDDEDDCDRIVANSNVNELQVLFNAAMIIRQKLQDNPSLNLPWPPLASDLTITNMQKVVPYELFNVLAWMCGFSSEPTLSEYVNITDTEKSKLMSIAQDLVNTASGGRQPTPKSIALGMALRQMTGSASVISLLNGLGHCMSHSYVLSHETALAQLNISMDSAVPPGFVMNVPTTLAWDNDDFCEETKSGKGTTHITGGIIIQRLRSTADDAEIRKSIPRSRSLPAPSKDIDPYFLGKRKTVNLKNAAVGLEIEEEGHVLSQLEAKKKDLAFTLTRELGNISGLPNWTGFNTMLKSNVIPAVSKIGYLPVIDASPTELATVKEILNKSEEIAKKLDLKYVCLVFDEAIYSKIQQIRWKDEHYLARFVIRLGDFHMAMSYCGSISKLFKDAGLMVSFCILPFI